MSRESSGASLTDRQWQVLRTACFGGKRKCGLSECELATELHIEEGTVKDHFTRIYRKLELVGAIPHRVENKKVLACLWILRVERAMESRHAERE